MHSSSRTAGLDTTDNAARSKKRICLIKLSSTHVVILHPGAAGGYSAQLAEVVGNNIVLGEGRAPFGTSRLEHFQGAALGPQQFVILYADETKNSQCHVVLGEVVVQGIVNIGRPISLSQASCSHLAITPLSSQRLKRHPCSTRRITCCSCPEYWWDTNWGVFHGTTGWDCRPQRALSEHSDGVWLPHGRLLSGNPNSVGRSDCACGAGQDRFIIVYRSLDERRALVRVGTVKHKALPIEDEEHQYDVVLGDEILIPTSNRMLTYLQVSAMTPSRATIAFADNREGSIALVELLGESVAVGEPARFSSSKPMSLSLSSLSPSSILLTYYTNDPWRALVLKGDIVQDVRVDALQRCKNSVHGEGSSIGRLAVMESVLSPSYSTHTHIAALSHKEFIAIFYDGGRDDAGVALAGTLGRGIGVAATSGTEGERVKVVLHGLSRSHRGLVPGECYFADKDGQPTKKLTINRLGTNWELRIVNSRAILKCVCRVRRACNILYRDLGGNMLDLHAFEQALVPLLVKQTPIMHGIIVPMLLNTAIQWNETIRRFSYAK
eukprot:scaffold3020_cov342-Prasinococcus_capsulatus_cf.AAC.10